MPAEDESKSVLQPRGDPKEAAFCKENSLLKCCGKIRVYWENRSRMIPRFEISPGGPRHQGNVSKFKSNGQDQEDR
jgi:hypothetical protein